MSAELYVMSDSEPNTLNTSGDDGFSCLICQHFINYTNETEWGEISRRGGAFTHMCGTEPFHYCPNCGRTILTPEKWVELHPEDQGKTFREIGKRFI